METEVYSGQLVRCDSSHSSMRRGESSEEKFNRMFRTPNLESIFPSIPTLHGREREETYRELFGVGPQQDVQFPPISLRAELPAYEEAMETDYVKSSGSEGEDTPMFENETNFQGGERNPKATPSAKRSKHPSHSSDENAE